MTSNHKKNHLNAYVWFLPLAFLSSPICCRIVRSPISDLLSQKELPEQTLQHDDACNVESRSTVSRTSFISCSVLSCCLHTIWSYKVCRIKCLHRPAWRITLIHWKMEFLILGLRILNLLKFGKLQRLEKGHTKKSLTCGRKMVSLGI